MGIEATGDPLWWDGLSTDQQNAVLGMMWREAEDEERDQMPTTKSMPTSKPRQPVPAAPSNSTSEAWAALMSHPGARW